MKQSNLILIKTFLSEPNARIASDYLESQGIATLIKKDDAGGNYPSLQLSSGVRLFVNDADEQAALALLNEIESDQSSGSAGHHNNKRIFASILIFLTIAGAIGFFIGNSLDKENNTRDKWQASKFITYSACTSGDCKNGQGVYIWANGDKYIGEFKGSKFNGHGTLLRANGNKYVGEFKEDHKNGQGTFIYASGSKYIGEFQNGHFNGQGAFIFANGSKYIGEFKDDEFSGQGTYSRANGDKYVGEFKGGKFNGQGIYTWANGAKYVGKFKDGIKSTDM
jgi:hypothetical protein